MPSISVIIPVYNVKAYIKQNIESLRGQTFKDFGAICINDGSIGKNRKHLNEVLFNQWNTLAKEKYLSTIYRLKICLDFIV